jgi:NTE family protein
MTEVYGVFEGGGVRGTAFVGAVAAAESQGISFAALAGTSAGSIIAALLAAGCSAGQLRDLLYAKDFRDFQDPVAPPGCRRIWSLWKLGFYKGKAFHRWMRDVLGSQLPGKHNPRIKDLPKPLTIIAADIANQDILEFSPTVNNDAYVADAVRMSMSIPFYFVPYCFGCATAVDGGILSNFPAWAFREDLTRTPLPVLGFRLQRDKPRMDIGNIWDFVDSLASTVVKTAVELQLRLAAIDRLNVIELPTLNVRATDFRIGRTMKEDLYTAGYNQTLGWLAANPTALHPAAPAEAR